MVSYRKYFVQEWIWSAKFLCWCAFPSHLENIKGYLLKNLCSCMYLFCKYGFPSPSYCYIIFIHIFHYLPCTILHTTVYNQASFFLFARSHKIFYINALKLTTTVLRTVISIHTYMHNKNQKQNYEHKGKSCGWKHKRTTVPWQGIIKSDSHFKQLANHMFPPRANVAKTVQSSSLKAITELG